MTALLFALLLSFGEAPAASTCGTGREAAAATEFLREINALRANKELAALELHPSLCRLARERAREIAREGDSEFDLLPDDVLFRRAGEAGYRPRFIAELEVQAEGTVRSVVAGWPGNVKETALDPAAHDLGVGTSRLDRANLYVLFFGLSMQEDFARRTASLGNGEAVIQEMLDRVNAERRKAGLPALRLHPSLSRAARRHAEDMLARSFYGHETPEGRTPLDRVKASGYSPSTVAENIARGQFSVEEVMDGWMESRTHLVNILGRPFTEAGLGYAMGINEAGPAVYWVQVFAAPRPP
ncbi:MAG: CAP domain-containing protein [Thermoanaerobaculia bacterium]